jgi:hypothetical protein
MPSYRFVTEWRIAAPSDRVFAAIEDTQGWPEWWPSVRSVERLHRGGDDPEHPMLGVTDRMTFVGRLPYQLAFDMRVAMFDPPRRLVGTATGELEGVGDWSLRTDGDWTVARYVWSVRTNPAWMNLLGRLPLVGEIFALNHHAVMRAGLRGLRAHLGGVAGTYRRED